MKLIEWAAQKMLGSAINTMVNDRVTDQIKAASSSSLSAPTLEDIQ